jgi:hypothetical protein
LPNEPLRCGVLAVVAALFGDRTAGDDTRCRFAGGGVSVGASWLLVDVNKYNKCEH